MPTAVDESKKFRIAADGGVRVIRRLFRIPLAAGHLESSLEEPLDAILVSFDLETSGWVHNRRGPIREAGFTILDTRHLFPIQMPLSLSQQQQVAVHGAISENEGNDKHGPMSKPSLISTKQYSILHNSENRQSSNHADCVFASTRQVRREDLAEIIKDCLEFPVPTLETRSVVIVGQSPQTDLKIAQHLGLRFSNASTIFAVIDTYRLSKSILGSALERHALSDILTELDVPYRLEDLHHAGNDATYTLYALIMLAARHAENMIAEEKGESTLEQLACVDRLRTFAKTEFEALRSKPTRDIGASEGVAPQMRTLGSGLDALARSFPE